MGLGTLAALQTIIADLATLPDGLVGSAAGANTPATVMPSIARCSPARRGCVSRGCGRRLGLDFNDVLQPDQDPPPGARTHCLRQHCPTARVQPLAHATVQAVGHALQRRVIMDRTRRAQNAIEAVAAWSADPFAGEPAAYLAFEHRRRGLARQQLVG